MPNNAIMIIFVHVAFFLFFSCIFVFEDITKLGFPHCESIDEIAALIRSIGSTEFVESYSRAIENYNQMTNLESS